MNHSYCLISLRAIDTYQWYLMDAACNITNSWLNGAGFYFILKALLHYAIFSATCLAMVENLTLQVAEVWCWGPVTLCNFLSNLSRNAPRNEKQEVCACAHVKIAVKLRDKLLEGWYTVQWCCQLLQSVAKSRAEFYFVQRFAQQKICETTHVTLCNSPATCLVDFLKVLRTFAISGLVLRDSIARFARFPKRFALGFFFFLSTTCGKSTCLATALRDKLLRKLHSVTGP